MDVNDAATAESAATPDLDLTRTAFGADRRRYPRLVFSPLDGVTAGLSFTTPDKADAPLPVQAMVMNLSRGGLGMGIPRDEVGGLTLSAGDMFKVIDLRIAYRQVRLALETQAEIRWAIDADFLDHLCFGCAFKPSVDPLRKPLTRFIADNFPNLALG